MTKRGAVQSYEGHVNSHSRIQLGVDQSERFLMAGLYHSKFISVFFKETSELRPCLAFIRWRGLQVTALELKVWWTTLRRKVFQFSPPNCALAKSRGYIHSCSLLNLHQLYFVYLFACAIAKILTFNMLAAYVKIPDESNGYEECVSGQKHSWGAWCGSQEGLFYLHWWWASIVLKWAFPGLFVQCKMWNFVNIGTLRSFLIYYSKPLSWSVMLSKHNYTN